MTAKPLTVCPEKACAKKRWGKGKVSRVIGAGAGLIFKGSGFYITDYRSEGYKEAAKNETAAPAAAPASSSSSGDSKSAATTKAEPKPQRPPVPRPKRPE